MPPSDPTELTCSACGASYTAYRLVYEAHRAKLVPLRNAHRCKQRAQEGQQP